MVWIWFSILDDGVGGGDGRWLIGDEFWLGVFERRRVKNLEIGFINLVIGLGDSETGETGEAGLKAGDGRTGIFGLLTGVWTGDTIPDFFDFAAFAAAHFRNNRAFTSF